MFPNSAITEQPVIIVFHASQSLRKSVCLSSIQNDKYVIRHDKSIMPKSLFDTLKRLGMTDAKSFTVIREGEIEISRTVIHSTRKFAHLTMRGNTETTPISSATCTPPSWTRTPRREKNNTESISFNQAKNNPDLKKILRNPNLKVRIIVDQGRAGKGHQAATITAINRLLDLGFQGKIEIVATDLMGGKDKFLSLMSGLKTVDLNQSFNFSDSTIILNKNITLRTIRGIANELYYEDSIKQLDPADILFSPACDYSFDQDSLRKYNVKFALITRPTGYVQNGSNGQVITPEQDRQIMALEHGIVFCDPGKPSTDSPFIQSIVHSKNEDEIDYINLYGREQSNSNSNILEMLTNNINLHRPTIIFVHQHNNNYETISDNKAASLSPIELQESISRKELSNEKIYVVHLPFLDKESFDYLTSQSNLLIAESSNTYQNRLFEGKAFIHAFGRSFSIPRLPKGTLSPQASNFENKYLTVQRLFEDSQMSCINKDSIISDVLTEIFQDSPGSKEYFAKLSEALLTNRPDRIASLFLQLQDCDFSLPTQGRDKPISINHTLLKKIESKLESIKNDSLFSPPGMENDAHFQLQKQNLKAIDIYLAIQSGNFDNSFWHSLRQVIKKHLEL